MSGNAVRVGCSQNKKSLSSAQNAYPVITLSTWRSGMADYVIFLTRLYITSSSGDDHALIIVTKMCLFNMDFLIVWMGSLGALANIMGRRGLTVYISVLFHVLITPIFINIAHHKPSEFAVAMPIQWSSLCHILVQERVPPIWWKILHSLNRLN